MSVPPGRPRVLRSPPTDALGDRRERRLLIERLYCQAPPPGSRGRTRASLRLFRFLRTRPGIRQPRRIPLSSRSAATSGRGRRDGHQMKPCSGGSIRSYADLLYALRRMGHGDEIAVVDTNFPAASVAMSTVIGEPIPMAGCHAARAVEAILSVMPLDTFVPDPACRMEIVGDPNAVPPVQREVQQASTARRASTCRYRASSASPFTSARRALSPSSPPANGAFTAASSSRRASCRRSSCRYLGFRLMI